MISIARHQIHLWLAFCDDINDSTLLDSYRAVMSEDERARELRFQFAQDRKAYVVTRALVRFVLARYAAVTPGAWQFTISEHGRPQIANMAAIAAGLTFNVAHSHGLIVLGVSVHRALGVDIENTRQRQVLLAVADRYFAADEVAALAAMPEERKLDRFFEYWTLKESYIKARGLGLSLPLDKFSFHFPAPRAAAIRIDAALADHSVWRFWQMRPVDDYLMAVCAENCTATPTEICATRIVPMRSEQPVYPQILRGN